MLLVKDGMLEDFKCSDDCDYYEYYDELTKYIVDKCNLPKTGVCYFCGEKKDNVTFGVEPFEEEVFGRIYVGEMCSGCYRKRQEDI